MPRCHERQAGDRWVNRAAASIFGSLCVLPGNKCAATVPIRCAMYSEKAPAARRA